jgi:hypothetical protein
VFDALGGTACIAGASSLIIGAQLPRRMKGTSRSSGQALAANLSGLRPRSIALRPVAMGGAGESRLASGSGDHACRDHVPTFPQRSPPSLLTTAACGGLRSTPDCRTRRAIHADGVQDHGIGAANNHVHRRRVGVHRQRRLDDFVSRRQIQSCEHSAARFCALASFSCMADRSTKRHRYGIDRGFKIDALANNPIRKLGR